MNLWVFVTIDFLPINKGEQVVLLFYMIEAADHV